MAVTRGDAAAQDIFRRFPRRSRRNVLGMSAYAYQEAVSLVLADMSSVSSNDGSSTITITFNVGGNLQKIAAGAPVQPEPSK